MDCPICEAEMERVYAEPDVGIFGDGWLCLKCNHFEDEEPDSDEWVDYDRE
jgi:hypothetical protein